MMFSGGWASPNRHQAIQTRLLIPGHTLPQRQVTADHPKLLPDLCRYLYTAARWQEQKEGPCSPQQGPSSFGCSESGKLPHRYPKTHSRKVGIGNCFRVTLTAANGEG